MLDSREYAEHWGRHWLDIVRYAETHGSEDDAYLPFAYRYRDYVIRAFEKDVPLDRLIQEHIAGDLIAPRFNPELGFNEALIGVCFYRLVEFNQTPVDVKREEIAVIDSQIDAMSKAFQGLTISCARCHDHKFDPISDEDYYALYGVLRKQSPRLSCGFDRNRKKERNGKIANGKTSQRHFLRIVGRGCWRDGSGGRRNRQVRL